MPGSVSRVTPLVGLLMLGGCGSEISQEPASSAPPPQQVVDPCAVLSEEQLRQLGARTDTKRTVSELDARGCGWLGDPFGFSLTTNPDTVADYRDRRDSPIFNMFRNNEVNGRPGVVFKTAGDEQCAQVLTAGSGGLVVNVRDSSSLSDPVDECAEALRIMPAWLGERGGRCAGRWLGDWGRIRGQGGEDSEHRRKYLVEEDEHAITGKLEPSLPPGGVIGEDPAAGENR